MQESAMHQPFCFDQQRFEETGRLFPESIEDDSRVAYHGTCSGYATTIENEGLVSRFRIYDFNEVLKIAESLPPEDRALSASLEEYARHSGTRLSFSPTSSKAADYSYCLGGQISAQLRRALQKARYQSAGIVQQLQALAQATPLVYAVELQTLLYGRVTNDPGSSNIYVDEAIAPDHIIARMNMPSIKPPILAKAIPVGPTYRELRSRKGTLVSALCAKYWDD